MQPKQLNGIKKVCCHKFFKNINTARIFLFLFLPAAEGGHPKAQYNLGCMYRDGNGVEVNVVKAVEWIQKGMLLRFL
jgi:TPR repeat protein